MTPEQHAKVLEDKITWAQAGLMLAIHRLRSEDRDDSDTALPNLQAVETTLREALAIMRAEGVGVPAVRIPTSEDEAALMVLLGVDWLTKNAPHRLVGTSTVPIEPTEVKP